MPHSVTLTWTASTDAVTGYNVYRGAAAGAEGTTALNASPITATTYTDTTVTPGNWFYVVKAIENGASSVASGEVSTVILPAAPTNLVVSAAS